MILSEYGSVLTQKKEQRMVFIKPVIDIGSNTLTLKCQGLLSFTSFPLFFEEARRFPSSIIMMIIIMVIIYEFVDRHDLSACQACCYQ